MPPSPTSILRDATIIDAARLLTSEDVGSLPVVEGDELVQADVPRTSQPTETGRMVEEISEERAGGR